MKKIVWFVTALVAITTLCLSADLTFPKNIVPADAIWAVHLDVQTFMKGKLYKMMEAEDAFRKVRIGRDMVSGVLGVVDLTKAIDKITLIGLGRGDRAVVCIEGDLPRDRLLALAKIEDEYREIPFGSTVIHSWDRNEFGAFAGNRMALLSEDLPSLQKVLDVISGKSPSFKSEEVLSRIKAQSGDIAVVGFARNVSDLIGTNEGPAILEMIGHTVVQAGEKGDDVVMSLHIETPTENDARQFEKVLNGLVALASMERGNRASALQIDPRDLSVVVKGNRVEMSLAYPLENFKKLLMGRTGFRGFASFAEFRSFR
jgi:hypothetical protein